MEHNAERPCFLVPPPTPLNSAAEEESEADQDHSDVPEPPAECDVSRITVHEFRSGVPFFQVEWDTKGKTWKPYENLLPHSINALKNYFCYWNDTKIRSVRTLPAIENLNKAVNMRAKSSVKYGCNEKCNCPRVALQDVLRLDIGRDQELSFEEIDQDSRSAIEKADTQRSFSTRLSNLVVYLPTCRRVQGWGASWFLGRKAV